MGVFKGFSSVELRKPKRSMFDLSNQERSSTRAGRLTPVMIREAIPSDTFRGSTEMLVRVAPLLAPIFDQLNVYVHYFFVPNRLLWSEWETFITGGRLGEAVETEPIPPYFDIQKYMEAGFSPKSQLGDYLGVPIFDEFTILPSSYAGMSIDAMPFLAYQRCYMDYYRDRNYVSDEEIALPVPSGEIDLLVNSEYAQLRTRAYLHDRFTSSLPFTQRGPEVLMPLDGTGTVSYLDTSQVLRNSGAAPSDGPASIGSAGFSFLQDDETFPLRVQNIDEVLLTASSVSYNDFRAGLALQVWLERNAVGGSRYTESTQAHFGIKPEDSRLQRAEFIGGGRISIRISEVVSTAWSQDNTDAAIPLANMAGHGVTYGNTNKFSYFVKEHGFIIGIASIMNPPSYHQGLPQMFRRRSFLDYPWPTFATLGEEQVNKSELYASPENLTEGTDGQLPLFGYNSRYSGWKWYPNTNKGDFHDTLLFWTMTRNFADSPTLNNNFVEFDESTQDRIFAVNGDVDNFWLYYHNKVTVVRPLPYFGKPNTMGFGS